MSTLKQICAEKVVELHVKSDMVVGLGTGSTIEYAVKKIGQLLKQGDLHNIVGVATSEKTRVLAESLAIPLADLDSVPRVDVAIDGADEVDSNLHLVKGRGGALLREKMVEQRASHFIVAVDESKMQSALGMTGPLPVEIVKYSWKHTRDSITRLPCLANISSATLATLESGAPYITDNNNYILNLSFSSPIVELNRVASDLKSIVGVVEHGLFVDMAHEVVIAKSDGSIDIKRRS